MLLRVPVVNQNWPLIHPRARNGGVKRVVQSARGRVRALNRA
jgi:hypothetical protein